VGAIDVGVSHDDDPVVAQVLQLEVLADPGTQRRDQGLDLVVVQDLVEPRPLGVENLAAQRQDRLEVAVASLLGAASRRVALDDVQL